jgi:hypothetical protein
MAREGRDGPFVYVGMAGERAGSGRPQGLRGRLRVYGTGKALTSGLGEAVADRAFADADWLRGRLHEVEQGRPMRAKRWGKATFDRADLYVCWTVTGDKAAALALEKQCGRVLADAGLWNRARF